MTDSPASDRLLELASLVRGALILADELALSEVAIPLDEALNRLCALDETGHIVPVSFELPPLEVQSRAAQQGAAAA